MIIASPGIRRYADSARIVIRYIEAVRNGNTHAIADVVATDATWDYPGDLPMSGIWRGRGRRA